MILTETVEVIAVPKTMKYWSSKGYNASYGAKLTVSVNDLPPNSNKLVEISCDDCTGVWTAKYQTVARRLNHIRCYMCTRKHVGKTTDYSGVIAQCKSRIGDKHPRWNPNKDAYALYKHGVYQATTKWDLSVLPNSDKPRGLCGVDGAYQLDHIISVYEGFQKNLPVSVIGHIDNLRFIPWRENLAKSNRSVEV